MQINAISNQNFGSNAAYGQYQNHPNTQMSEIELLDRLADKVNSDVHPSTIMATVAAVVLAAKSARGLVPIARRLTVKAGEVVAKGVAQAVNYFKKGGEEDLAKRFNKIRQKAEVLYNNHKKGDVPQPSKFMEKVKEFASDILGNENGQTDAFMNGLKKAKITNGVEAFDAAASVAVGAAVLDPTSDKIEQLNDTADIIEGIGAIVG